MNIKVASCRRGEQGEVAHAEPAGRAAPATGLLSLPEPRKNQRLLVGEPAGVSTEPHMSRQEAMGKPLALASCKQHC